MTPVTQLKWKPDFARTCARFEAWWRGEVLDRPPVQVWLQPARPYRGPQKNHASRRDSWLDAEYNVARMVAGLETMEYPADNIPCFWPNVGPEITATLFGCELDFGEHTSWSHPVVHDAGEWERILGLAPDFANVYWQTIERMADHALAINDGRYVVGLTDLHGNYDILAGLRDPQELCMDVLDCPEILRRVGAHAARAYVAAFERSYRKVAAAGFGSTTWTPMYHQGPAYVPSCDFWCMVSPDVARDLILPDIVTEMQPLQRSIFHLDGPNALQHLDLLLDLPQLTALQWVYGAGNGPAAKWLDVYRRSLAAGKPVQIFAAGKEDALHCLKELGPRGVWLCVGDYAFANVAEVEDFLREVTRLSTRA